MAAEITYTVDNGEKLANETYGPNNIRRRTSGTVGRSPTRLWTAAGPRIDPPVSSAIATVAKLAATPEPLPLDDPLAFRFGSYAFRI